MNTSKVTFGVAAVSLLCFLHSAVMDALKKNKVLIQILLFNFLFMCRCPYTAIWCMNFCHKTKYRATDLGKGSEKHLQH